MTIKVDYFRLRIGSAGTTDTVIAAKSRQADVLFVDIDAVGLHTAATIASGLRRLVPEIKAHAATVVRTPTLIDGAVDGVWSTAEVLRNEIFARLRTTESDLSLATLLHHPSSRATIYADEGFRAHIPSRDIAGELCAAEIRALIEHYDALLVTDAVQLLLPNDTLSSSFLRVADILHTRRDCEVVAEWVLPLLGADRSRVVLAMDSPGMLPLALALELRVRDGGGRVVQTFVSEVYPFGGGDSDSLFPDLGACSSVVYLLSTSRSGRFEGLIAESLEAIAEQGTPAALVVVADMRAEHAHTYRRVSRHRLAEIVPPAEVSRGDMAGRPTVRVRPVTFTLEPEFDYTGGERFPQLPLSGIDGLLPLMSSGSCVGVECSPFSVAGSVRPRSRLISFRVLLEEFSNTLAERVADDPAVQSHVRRQLESFAPSYDLVILPDADAMSGGLGLRNAEAVLQAAGVNARSFVTTSSLPPGSASATSALLFVWGSVTGSSAVRAVRDLRANLPDAKLDCVVVHLRPPSEFEAEYLKRTLQGGSFSVVWLTVLPWTSAFAAEASRLNRWISADPSALGKWSSEIDDRLAVIAPTGPHRDWRTRTLSPPEGLGERASALFWVDPSGVLDGGEPSWLRNQPTTLLAAACVLEGMRNAAPSRLRFGFEAITAENPHPAWVAAIVRQARAGEMSFGTASEEQRQTADYLCAWMEEHDATGTVLAELLAGDAVGKLSTNPSQVFRSLAQEWSTRNPAFGLLLDFVAWSRGD